jgi:hypothetical protein
LFDVYFFSTMASLINSFFLFASFLPNILSPPAQNANDNSDIGGKTFDYIIVGGGLTGLTVANRLSEDSTREYDPGYSSSIAHT